MISKHLAVLVLSFVCAVPALAASDSRCHWSVEGVGDNYKNDALYKKPPVMTTAAFCAGPTGTIDGSEPKPICTGNIYCEYKDAIRPPMVATGSCFAVKVNKKWMCPSAQACIDDNDVLVSRMAQMPEKQSAAPARGSSGGGVINEGQGQGGR